MSPATVLRVAAPLALRAAAAAYPSELAGDAARFDAARAHQALFGAGWERELEARGHDVHHVAREHGVESRDWCRGTEVTGLDLAVAAARRALAGAGWRASDLGFLAVATCTPAHVSRCLAAAVAEALGATCGAVDVRGGGAGGLDAWVAASLAAAAGAGRVLAVAVETTSLWLDRATGTTALLFGDGAGAVAIEHVEGAPLGPRGGLTFAAQGAAPSRGTSFTVPGALPPRSGDAYTFRAPDAAYQADVAAVGRTAAARLAAEVSPGDLFVPYAVRRAQVEAAAAEVGLDPSHTLAHLARHGALGCAGPLTALAERLADPQRPWPSAVAALAVGGGIRWAALRFALGEPGERPAPPSAESTPHAASPHGPSWPHDPHGGGR